MTNSMYKKYSSRLTCNNAPHHLQQCACSQQLCRHWCIMLNHVHWQLTPNQIDAMGRNIMFGGHCGALKVSNKNVNARNLCSWEQPQNTYVHSVRTHNLSPEMLTLCSCSHSIPRVHTLGHTFLG